MKNIKKIGIIILISIMLLSFSVVYASDGEDPEAFINNQIIPILALIAGFVCLGKLIQIGIMYMLSGANDKSQAKTAVLPWVIGTIICGGYTGIHSKVVDKLNQSSGGFLGAEGDVKQPIGNIGDTVLSYLMLIAGSVAVGVLIWIGIKYMMAGAGEKATVKRNAFPWLIGLFVVVAASTIMEIVIGWGSDLGKQRR